MRDAARVGAGVPDGGRFAPSRRPAAPVALDDPSPDPSPDPLPASVRAAIDSIDPEQLAWMNSRDRAFLTDTADPASALGRCFFASRAVHEHLTRTGLPAGELVEVLLDDDSDHYANAFATDADTYIVDYTFRQFDPNADWPSVARFDDWLAQLGNAAARRGVAVQTFDFGPPEDFD